MKTLGSLLLLLTFACGHKEQQSSQTQDIRNLIANADYAIWREGDKVFAKKCAEIPKDKPARDCKEPAMDAKTLETDFNSFEDAITFSLSASEKDKKLSQWVEHYETLLAQLEKKGQKDTTEFKKTQVVVGFFKELKDALDKLGKDQSLVVTHKTDAIWYTLMQGFSMKHEYLHVAKQEIRAQFINSRYPQDPTDWAVGYSYESAEKALAALEENYKSVTKKYNHQYTIYRGEIKTDGPTHRFNEKNKDFLDKLQPRLFVEFKVTYSSLVDGKKESFVSRSNTSYEIGKQPYMRGNAKVFLERECAVYAQIVSANWETCEITER